MYWNGGGGGWVLMAGVMVLFGAGVAAVVVAIAYNTRQHNARQHHGAGPNMPGQDGPGSTGAVHDRALAVLAERFARGEIDVAEYTARRDALRAP